MKWNMILPSVLAASLLSMPIILHAEQPVKTDAANKETVYTEDKLSITVNADHPEFTIQLKSNPTTGYSWFLREYNANLLMPVKHRFQRPLQQLVGAPGDELWTFRVKPAGFVVPHQLTIRFIYARPWQSNDSTTQLVFRVTTQEK